MLMLIEYKYKRTFLLNNKKLYYSKNYWFFFFFQKKNIFPVIFWSKTTSFSGSFRRNNQRCHIFNGYTDSSSHIWYPDHWHSTSCQLCTLAECIWQKSWVRVARDETGQVRLDTLAESSQFWHATWGDSQARYETLAHGTLKKRDLNEARHKRRGYTRGSKARRVFPPTLSLWPCRGFPWWEYTAGIMLNIHLKAETLVLFRKLERNREYLKSCVMLHALVLQKKIRVDKKMINFILRTWTYHSKNNM